jgi:putative restriction endonuclease
MSDTSIRRAAFDWLAEQTELHGAILPRELLAKGFGYQGHRIPLVAPNGIFKPQRMELPLSITTVANGPYRDAFGPSLLQYKYRGKDPNHRDNVGMRELLRRREPLIYFHALVPGRYLAIWPVFVVGDDPATLTFSVAVDDTLAVNSGTPLATAAEDAGAAIRRQYITTVARRRIHQAAFRERVIDAYRQQCAVCRLKHEELLDAAHIIPDSDPEGEPVVPNGISLCKIHHAAFDHFFLSVRPDYMIEIRIDVLSETDGPMLKHGLQGMHGKRMEFPRRTELRPSPVLLERRHQRFLAFAEGREMPRDSLARSIGSPTPGA